MEEILHQAGRLEKDYDWFGAAGLYEKAASLLPEDDFSSRGTTCEKLGYAFYRFAFQAETNDEFRQRLRQATANYEKVRELSQRLNEPKKTGIVLRSEAMNAYIGYWLASEVSEKKRLLDDCWRLTKEALKAFEEAKDVLEYGKTYNRLSSSTYYRFVFESSFQAREKIMEEALVYGEHTITLLSGVSDYHELAKVYVKTASFLSSVSWHFVSDMDEKESHNKKCLDYWHKANELSEETASLELLSLTGGSLDWTIDEELAHYDKALGYAKKTKDRYLIGTALDGLAYTAIWKAAGTDDPDRSLEFLEKSLQYAKDTTHQFSLISYTSPRGAAVWTGAPNGDYHFRLARLETDPKKKRDLLEKAVIEGTKAIEKAENTGYPLVVMYAHEHLVRTSVYLAQLGTNSEEKRKLLEKALEHSTKSVKVSEQLDRFSYWNRGVNCCFLADLTAELSDVERDAEKRKNMLEEAISIKERGLQLCAKSTSYSERKGNLSAFGVYGHNYYTYGKLLNRLYGFTNNKEHQRRAVKAFEEAARLFQKLNMSSRVAECHWKVAGSCNALGEHLMAADNFSMASNDYKSAGGEISQLKDFYQDHACYMQAWTEVEKGRYHHERQQYGLAKEHFEKAGDLHKSLKKWSYLAPNYCAWASVEYAEDLSRKEQCEDASRAFKEAIKLFDETKKSIQNELGKIEDKDEKRMANSMVKATYMRHEYCVARIAIEEAKILDKKGDHYLSSEKYGQAAEALEKMSQAPEAEQERKEFNLIISLSHAWQKMTLAEAKSSPILYLEASQIFEQAEDLSPNEKTKALILGHSRFCKALEAGTRFTDSRDPALHQIAEQHLESAASYYVRAGFQNASEYSKAIEHLFDAYLYMDDAKREKDPEKKARLYIMAERVLQTSAGSFLKAEHLEKREQVQRLLEKVKEERELAMSLSEVFHAPSIVSTTAAFNTPGQTHENAVGLEKFEHADVHANIIVNRNELRVGENLELEIELANAGKGTALLDKIEGAIPDGFEITERLQTYRVEGCNVNMRGRKLEQLKGEDVKFLLKPKHKGSFTLRPVVFYLDENGNSRSHEPEPVTITVKELGIKGWLKGER